MRKVVVAHAQHDGDTAWDDRPLWGEHAENHREMVASLVRDQQDAKREASKQKRRADKAEATNKDVLNGLIETVGGMAQIINRLVQERDAALTSQRTRLEELVGALDDEDDVPAAVELPRSLSRFTIESFNDDD